MADRIHTYRLYRLKHPQLLEKKAGLPDSIPADEKPTGRHKPQQRNAAGTVR